MTQRPSTYIIHTTHSHERTRFRRSPCVSGTQEIEETRPKRGRWNLQGDGEWKFQQNRTATGPWWRHPDCNRRVETQGLSWTERG